MKRAFAWFGRPSIAALRFMDNSWDYNEGQSEILMGKALKDGYRQKVFLMTKIDGRTKEAAERQIETCLERLQTDHIDLVQHHEIIRFDDPDRIFAESGANEAMVAAQKAGKIRYIGFTGHKDPHIHLYMLKVAAEHGFHFDSVQMPLNVMDAHFRSFGQMVLPELVKQEIGVLGMKSMGDGVILKSKTVSPIECLHYALSLPTSVVITGIDKPEILDQAFEAVKTFQPMNREQIAQLAGQDEGSGDGGKVRIVQDFVALRFDREASGLAGRGCAGCTETSTAERIADRTEPKSLSAARWTSFIIPLLVVLSGHDLDGSISPECSRGIRSTASFPVSRSSALWPPFSSQMQECFWRKGLQRHNWKTVSRSTRLRASRATDRMGRGRRSRLPALNRRELFPTSPGAIRRHPRRIWLGRR